MPDMGFPHDVHDRDPRPPRTWGEALSSLPLDTPDSDGWARLAACLPVAGAEPAPPTLATAPAVTGSRARGRPRRRRRLAWLATAAVLATVASIPLLQTAPPFSDEMGTQPPRTGIATRDPAAATATGTPVMEPHRAQSSTATATAPTAAASPSRDGSDVPVVATTTTAPRQDATADIADPPAPARAAGTAATGPDRATAAAPLPRNDDDRIAVADASGPRPAPDGGIGTVPVDGGAAADDELARLHAESARLEALVAIARDDNVGSAPTTVLIASLDERIGRIDGALSQPGLDRDTRLRLWHSRIEALHELAGVESTQRWLSARGEAWNTALVQVD